MKVSNVRPVQTSTGRKGSGTATSAPDGPKVATMVGSAEATETQGVTATRAVAAADALLAAQEAPDSAAGMTENLRHGAAILDHLDDLRIGLLDGLIPKEELVELIRSLTAGRADTTDPGLAAVLNEIELRASVELAKLSINL